MKIEIRKEIRDFILDDVNLTLARLGISEKPAETNECECNHGSTIHYEFETPAIRQRPMMFKKLYVYGYMVATEEKDENNRYCEWSHDHDIVVVKLDYRWISFRNGSNGTEIGRIIYAVKKDLPERFGGFGDRDALGYYVVRLRSLDI